MYYKVMNPLGLIWITFSKIISPATWYYPWHQRNLRRWSKCIRPSHIWDVVKRWDCFTRVKQLQIKSRWRFYSANFCLEDWIFLDACTSRPFLHLSNESVGRQRPYVTNHVRLQLEKRVNNLQRKRELHFFFLKIGLEFITSLRDPGSSGVIRWFL